MWILNLHVYTDNETGGLDGTLDREAYETKREQAIEDIRLRYSKVIDELKQEKGKGVEERLHNVEKQVRKIFSMMDSIRATVEELKLKDQIRNI